MLYKKEWAPSVFILVIFFFVTQCIFNQERGKVVRIKRIESPPKINGVLDDACWQSIQPIAGFYQYDPLNGMRASEETFVWLAYDSRNIYFAFHMKDSHPERIWAELTPRNNYSNNDSITVILDTYNDKRTSIQFTVNPKGIQKNSVETIWKSGAVIGKDGWMAEMAIPFKSLRFSSQDNQVWGINFARYIHRLKETDYWTNVNRDIPLLQQMGEVKGLSGIKPSFNIEFFPYFGYRSSRWDGDSDDRTAAGLDFKYGILPNLILDLTASPDFSEVESDPFIYQLSPYENYLTENRPFFSEGSQYFGSDPPYPGFRESQFNLFYSRRIHSPKISAKVTGKTGGYSFGILGALNKEEGDDSVFSIVRMQKDIFRNSQIGIYYAGLNRGDEYNRNVAVDYNFNFKNIYYIRGQSAFSFNSNSENKNNGMHVIQFQREPDAGVVYQIYYKRVEENVKVETGYIDKTNTQFIDLDLGYAWRLTKGKVKHIFANTSVNLEYDCSGSRTLETFSILNRMEFLSNLEFHWWLEGGKSKYQVINENNELAWTEQFIDLYIANFDLYWERGGFLKNVNLEAEWTHRGIYNDDFSQVEPGSRVNLEFSISLRPRSNFEWSIGGEWTRQVLDSTGEKVFEGITYETALHFQMTRDLFLSSRLKGETREEQYHLDVLLGYYFGAGNIVQLSFKRGASVVDALREKGYSITLKVSYLLRI